MLNSIENFGVQNKVLERDLRKEEMEFEELPITQNEEEHIIIQKELTEVIPSE